MAKGRGKPCGASYISRSKVCRVSMHPDLDKAMNAASGSIGARTLQGAVRAYGQGPMKEYYRIKNELRAEVGGNIVKGPKADEVRRRLREAGLLPGGKEEGTLRREISLDREEQAKAYRDMGMKTKDAVAQAKSDIPSEKSSLAPAAKEANRNTNSKALSDIERILRGEDPKHEEFKVKSSEKSQIAQLQSVLGLGSLTRQEVGRDYSGLIQEAKYLYSTKLSEYKQISKLEKQYKRQGNADPAQMREIRDEKAQRQNELKRIKKAIDGSESNASGGTISGRESSREFDDRLSTNVRRVGDDKYEGWDSSYGSGSKVLGKGAYGTAIRSKDGIVIKRGDVSNTEADVLKIVGGADLGPRLIAADVNGPGQNPNRGVDIRRGRIAMSLVPGDPVGKRGPGEIVNGVRVSDAFWKARADLHRLGVAHNDMHIENVLIDDRGKGRFVDMGLAQASPKAALAEAMGAFFGGNVGTSGLHPSSGETQAGDWQVVRWNGTGGKLLQQVEEKYGNHQAARKRLETDAPLAARALANKDRAVRELKGLGLSNDEVATIMDQGIRSPMETYNSGPWAKLNDQQALSVINTLYEGI